VITARKPDADPVQQKLFENDRVLREAIGVITDIAHATPNQLIEAADTIERLTRNAELLSRAKWARMVAEHELKPQEKHP
tara:strand:+ start:2426 stop:2665 length:240 start_codon:yes stop_codon:yes gene_type:complete